MQPNPVMIFVEISWLTHLPLDKMAAILAALSNTFFLMKMTEFQFEFHWNLFPGDKPLPEPMITQFTDAYRGYPAKRALAAMLTHGR